MSLALLGIAVPFGTALLLGLAALLWATAGLVLLRARPAGGHGWARRATTVVLVGVTGTLLLRTVLGCWWWFTPADLDGRFYWLNLVLYTPLCAVLAACGLALLRPAGSEAHGALRRAAGPRAVSIAVPALVMLALVTLAYADTPTPQARSETRAQLGAIPSRYVDTAVARFHFISAGHGSPVVLLSPGSARLFAWLPQFRALATKHTVFAVDLPGQGFTRLHDPAFRFDLRAMTDAVGSFLDAEHLRDVALAGNSWSGGWALAYAQRHPDRVNRLLLLAPSGLAQADPPTWEALKLPLVGTALANVSAGSRSLTESGARELFVHRDRITPALLTAFWAPNTFPANVQATVRLEQHLDWTATQHALPATRQRTLIVWGRQDAVLPVRQAATFAARMPHADVHVLDRCGHALTLDCPDPVSHLMMDFLDER